MHSDRLCLSSISVGPGCAGDAFGDPAGGRSPRDRRAGGKPPAHCTCSVTTAVSVKSTGFAPVLTRSPTKAGAAACGLALDPALR